MITVLRLLGHNHANWFLLRLLILLAGIHFLRVCTVFNQVPFSGGLFPFACCGFWFRVFLSAHLVGAMSRLDVFLVVVLGFWFTHGTFFCFLFTSVCFLFLLQLRFVAVLDLILLNPSQVVL